MPGIAKELKLKLKAMELLSHTDKGGLRHSRSVELKQAEGEDYAPEVRLYPFKFNMPTY